MATASGTRDMIALAKPRLPAGVYDVAHPGDEARREARLCVAEGERLGLYSVISETGPVTVFGLALNANIPVSLALRWLTSQMQSGAVVRDVVTGRYRTWCVLPDLQEETER